MDKAFPLSQRVTQQHMGPVGNHFINVTSIVKDAITGEITHINVTNGYVNGVEQTKTITIAEFRNNYEGKILSKERSDYDKRLTNSEGAKFLDGDSIWHIANSKGFYHSYKSSYCYLYCVPIAEEDGKLQSNYWFSFARYFNNKGNKINEY